MYPSRIALFISLRPNQIRRNGMHGDPTIIGAGKQGLKNVYVYDMLRLIQYCMRGTDAIECEQEVTF